MPSLISRLLGSIHEIMLVLLVSLGQLGCGGVAIVVMFVTGWTVGSQHERSGTPQLALILLGVGFLLIGLGSVSGRSLEAKFPESQKLKWTGFRSGTAGAPKTWLRYLAGLSAFGFLMGLTFAWDPFAEWFWKGEVGGYLKRSFILMAMAIVVGSIAPIIKDTSHRR